MTNENLDQAVDAITKALKDLALGKGVSSPFIEFIAEYGESNNGKGLVWRGDGYTKQLVYKENPDRFFSSESIDLNRGNTFSINGVKVVSENELGPTVTKSSLREVGRLKGLIVDGSVSINQYLFYNATADRLGIGTDEPNATLSVAEDGVEVIIGATDGTKGKIGTHGSNDLDIVTDSTPRITVEAGGNIRLGNKNFGPIRVTVQGKLAVGVNSMDERAGLHVAGAIKFNDRLHQYAAGLPTDGHYEKGDIIWNTDPRPKGCVGWVCIANGNPGRWCPFGEIKDQQ